MAFSLPPPSTSSHWPSLTRSQWLRKSERVGPGTQSRAGEGHGMTVTTHRPVTHTIQTHCRILDSQTLQVLPCDQFPYLHPDTQPCTAFVCCICHILMTPCSNHKTLLCLTCFTLRNSHGSEPRFRLAIYSQKALLLGKPCLRVFQSSFKLLAMATVTAPC